MNDPSAARDQVLERVGDRAEAQVLVTTGPSELTRFANSFIHQNVGEMHSEVALTLAVAGRTAELVGSSTSDASLASLVEQALEVAQVSPVDPDWPGVAPQAPVTDPEAFSPDTAEATPQDRADAVKAFIDAGEGLNAAGYCETQTRSLAFGSTAGQLAEAEVTRVVMDGIHRTATSSGSGHHCSCDLASLDAAGLGQQARLRALQGENPVTVEAGTYEVVLGHDAMAEVVLSLGIYGFAGRGVVDQQSFAVPGAAQFDPALTIVDDAHAPGGVNPGFDTEGTPKQRWVLVDEGVTGEACHSRRTAHQMNATPNGFAPSGDIGKWYGGGPVDLIVAAGSKSVDQLIGAVDRGIFVATFNYCRGLDPVTAEVTGLTRNGTFLIENGQITQPLTNMRFTQSFVEALAPGNLLGLSSDPRYAMADSGPAYVRTPAAHLASFQFTGNANG